MTAVLALETSSELCSVALYCDGEVHLRQHPGVRDHTARVLPFVDALLAEAGISLVQLDALALGRGPGSFTGLRVAAAMIQGLAYGADLGVAPVSSLQALALQAADQAGVTTVLAVIDARMDEVYACAYCCKNRIPVALGPECLLAPEALFLPRESAGGGLCLAGSGLAYGPRLAALADVDDGNRRPALLPHAREVAVLAVDVVAAGELLDPAAVQPVYLRNKVAQRPSAR